MKAGLIPLGVTRYPTDTPLGLIEAPQKWTTVVEKEATREGVKAEAERESVPGTGYSGLRLRKKTEGV